METSNVNLKNWKSLIKPGKLDINLNDDKSYAKIVAEPLEKGYGLTLGNSLRRILLSSIRGTAVTAIQIDGVLHEFTSIKGVREDVTDIVLNVKSLALKSTSEGSKKLILDVKGPGVIKASDITKINEIEILNYAQMNFIQNGLYMVAFTAFVFITFRLMRFQREQNANIFGKVLVTIFGLCTVFFGYNVFSFLYVNQLGQSYRLSELQSSGVELSALSQNWVDYIGYTVSDGLPIPFSPEPTAYIFLITLGVMVIAGVWVNLSKN